VYAWYWPPTTLEFAPQATSSVGTTREVEDRSETAVVLLIGLGILGIILAANGRKLASAKFASQELTFEGAAAKIAEETTKERGKAAGLSEEKISAAALLASTEAYVTAQSRGVDSVDFDAVTESAIGLVSGSDKSPKIVLDPEARARVRERTERHAEMETQIPPEDLSSGSQSEGGEEARPS